MPVNAVSPVLDLGPQQQGSRGSPDKGDPGLFAETLGREMGRGDARPAREAEKTEKAKATEKKGESEQARASDKADSEKKVEEKKPEEGQSASAEDAAGSESEEKAAGDTGTEEQEAQEAEVLGEQLADKPEEDGNILPAGLTLANATATDEETADIESRGASERRQRDVMLPFERLEERRAGKELSDEKSFSERLLAGKDKEFGSEISRMLAARSPGERGETMLKDLQQSLRTQAAQPAAANSGTGATGAMGQTPSTASQTAATAQLSVPVPVRKEGWDQAFGQRVVWMARSGVQQAQVQVNPRNLGPVEIRVSVQNDQASVTFVANNGATREAIESAMPRLREMMAEQGLNLSDSQVTSQEREQRSAAGEGGGRQTHAGGLVDEDGEEASELTGLHETITDGSAAIDFFA